MNVLSSLEYFIQTNDMKKLATYYQEHIQPTQESLARGAFNFQELKNIQSDEIKSIFAIKLLSAREKEIDVQIEIPDTIPKLSQGFTFFNLVKSSLFIIKTCYLSSLYLS